MELTELQKDALSELINIAYSRAAGALSDLTGHRIVLGVPKVEVYPISKVTMALQDVLSGEIATVQQIFSGPVSGNALLLLDQKAALLLNGLLTDDVNVPTNLDGSVREVLTEVGNIVLNACLGAFGNLLQVQVSFAVPRLHLESIEGVLKSISVRDEELRYALMVHTKFHLRASNVSGYLVIVLGVTSLDKLLSELERWQERQLQL